MAKKNFRGGRIGEEIRRIISDLLLRELKDPRFGGMVSISSVKASDDGSFATVYFTMLGSDVASEPTEAEKHDAIDAFINAKGLIRSEVGSRLELRYTPDLRFFYDTTEEYGRHIERLIDELDLPEEEKPLNTISDLAVALKDSQTIRIFPHENPDGDTLGSSVALCLALRDLDKDAQVIIDEKIPDNIAFIVNDCCIHADNWLDGTGDEGLFDDEYDMAVLVDVGETTRIGRRGEIFDKGLNKMMIDHHVSSRAIYDYNLIDTSVAAAAEIVYDILRDLGITPDTPTAEAIYVGILTDTGRFQFSNTTPRAHQITAELLNLGVNPNHVSTEIYHNMRLQKLYLENAVMSTTISVCGGKGLVALLKKSMLEETGAMEEETEGLAEKLRSFRGVEVSVFLREIENGKTRGSLRSKSSYDVAALAQKYGGGGHIRAAGFTSDQAPEQLRKEIVKILNETL